MCRMFVEREYCSDGQSLDPNIVLLVPLVTQWVSVKVERLGH